MYESLASNGAKWTHVGVSNAVEKVEQPANEAPGNDLLTIHATRFASPPNPRSDDEILFSCVEWLDQLRKQFRAVAAIAVEKGDYVAVARHRIAPRPTGPPIATPWFCDD